MPDAPPRNPERSPPAFLTRFLTGVGSNAHTFVRHRALPAVQAFIDTEASGGLVLFAASIVALVWANSALDSGYEDLWGSVLSLDGRVIALSMDLRHWVNDGLMTLFFFLAGLEIKRELVRGELRTWRRAAVPVIAAAGGMALPAAIYLAFTAGGDAAHGWGIPMATDIAFALGLLALGGSRVPFGLKVFVLALAVVDDIASITVIALFYSGSLDLQALAVAGGILVATVAGREMGNRSMVLYAGLAAALWIALEEAGVAPTLAGVVFGLLTPAGPRYDTRGFAETASGLVAMYAEPPGAESEVREDVLLQFEDLVHGSEAPLERTERAFHPWVSFVVLPLFALANVGVVISADSVSAAAASPIFQGVFAARILGKVAGIFFATYLALRLGVGELPSGATLRHVIVGGVVASVGFTVSLLVADRAFDSTELVDFAKLALLAASVAGAIGGYALLRFVRPSRGPA